MTSSQKDHDWSQTFADSLSLAFMSSKAGNDKNCNDDSENEIFDLALPSRTEGETFNLFNGSGPQEVRNNKSVDAILANELNKLTFRERETINEEIHGIDIDRTYIEETGAFVEAAFEETPEILAQSFCNFAIELENLRSTESGVGGSAFGFNRSQELFGSTSESTYLNTNEIRVMFLRAERFDCLKAAKRFCAFANELYESYGDFALERRPRLSDLSVEDLAALKEGRTRLFSGRDRAGRRIYAHYAHNSWDSLSVNSRMRVSLYIIMSFVDVDVVSQRKGVVGIVWWHGLKKLDTNNMINRGIFHSRSTKCSPVRIGALHFCFPSYKSSKNTVWIQIISRLAGQMKPHIRIHSGSNIECAYALESFGINMKQNPLNITTGELDPKSHNRWLELCAAKEENSKLYKRIIECPNYTDILFGRGQILMNHPGNTMFRNFIRSKLDAYTNVRSKKEATQWTWGAVRTLKNEYGVRFLKEERVDSGAVGWVEVTNEVARSKVRIALRDATSRLKKTMEKQTNPEYRKSNNALGTKTKKMSRRSKDIPPSLTPPAVLSKRKKCIPTQLDDILTSSYKQENDKMVTLDDFLTFKPPSSLSVLPPPSSSQIEDDERFDLIEDDEPFDLTMGEFGEDIRNNLSTLNENLSNLNNNLTYIMHQQQGADSFVAMDCSNASDGSASKRQRFCDGVFFNCI